MTEDRKMIDGTLNALRILCWKFIIMQFTAVDINDVYFDTEAVWKMSVRRLHSRLKAAEWAARTSMLARPATAERQRDRATRKMAPLASMTNEGMQLSDLFEEFAKEAGARIDETLQTAKENPRRTRITRFVKETLREECEEHGCDTTSDRDGVAWHVKYLVMTKRQDEQVTIYLQTTANPDDIFEVKENEMLPLREATGGKFDDIFVKATRRSKTEMMVMYARPQIFMFAPGAERQDARDYALDLIDGGLNEAKMETIVQRDDTEHNLKQIARQLYWKMTSRDVWKLRGPRVKTVGTLDEQ